MLLSVANSRPRNLESSRVSSLFPDTVQESSKTLIEFVEKYYEYLNVVGLPSSEIANITSAKDIDVVSNKYLTEIQSLIARNIPNSVALDKVTLYKIILQYYRTRGSEDSIHSFFKIFFDEFVTIFYPRDYLFELSGGRGQWMPIVASQLATVNTNPNKNQIKIVSDAIIGPVTSNDKAPYTFVLQSYSKFVWTLDGRAPSSTVPHLQKVNSRWVYTYGDVVVTSANNTTWPDEALWNTFSRNIEYTSGNAGSNTTRNIEYKTLEITPVGETTETILLKRDDTTDILATESGDELTLEQFFTPEGTIDIVVSGITTENNLDPNTSTDYIIVQDTSITNTDDAVIVTEDAGSSLYTAITSNIEYVHLFTVTALPLNALKIDDLINSLETAGTNTVYRCTQISPTIWESVTTDFRIWQYSDSKSFASDRYKLHDGEFWQKYSYQIKTTLSYDTWSYDYLRFVHPAGLKLFTALLYELLAKSEWKQYIDYISSDSTTDYTWLGAYIPPVIGYHTPTSQPGWLTSRERVLKFLLQVLRDANADESLIRIIELVLSFESLNEVYRDKIVHNTYQSWFKFIDTTELIAGFSDKTIALANAEYSREDLPLFSNLSCIVTPKVVDFTYYPWMYSELIPLNTSSQSIDPNYVLSDVNVFDVDFEPYINSEILPREASTVYNLQTENNNYSITEDSEFGFVTEGNITNTIFNTYTISALTNIVTPNNRPLGYPPINVYFHVVTTGVLDGTQLYYTTRFPSVLAVTSGVVTITNDFASFAVQINEALAPGFPTQSFNMDLRLNSITGPIVATSNLVIIFP